MTEQEKQKATENRNKNIIPKMQEKIENNNFTLITNTCLAGFLYHDLNLKFLTPTINLYITPKDFVKFCDNLKYYLNKDLIEEETNFNFPIGKLDDITVYFVHYNNFKEAKDKWNIRKQRVNYDNLFIIMTDRIVFSKKEAYSCSEDVIKEFDKLNYKNKIVLTHNKLPYKSSQHFIYSNNVVPNITKYKDISGIRYYDLINTNIIDWLNSHKN